MTHVNELGTNNIRRSCILAAPEVIKKSHSNHHYIKFYATSVTDNLNDKVSYIVPGLGYTENCIFGPL